MKLVWLDLEMTGLDVKKEVIIEVAATITDMDFNNLGSYHSIIKQDQKYLDNMDEWNTNQHTKTGLVAQIPKGIEPQEVENQLCDFVKKHLGDEPAVLAGNSIWQDRRFIEVHMPKFYQLLHYRMLDVTAWKLIFKEKFGKEYQKKETHRAVDDIQESIDELKFYLSELKN